MSNKDLYERVNTALDKVRPFLIADGGNVSIEKITDDNKVMVKFTGACGHCPFSTYTFKSGIESTILKEVPEITEVIAI